MHVQRTLPTANRQLGSEPQPGSHTASLTVARLRWPEDDGAAAVHAAAVAPQPAASHMIGEVSRNSRGRTFVDVAMT